LAVADSILPDDLKVERTDLVNRAQSEWQFVVLSSKLHDAYRSELNEMEDKIKQMTAYSGEVWDSLKGLWNKVQEQVKDRNLSREHADTLRETTNELFERLKGMRSSMANEFETNSKNLYGKFSAALDDIERKVEEGLHRFPGIFEDLKSAQTQFRDAKMTREHSGEIWNRIDNLFKIIKERRFGNNAINDTSAVDRMERRYEGLIGAIEKMQQSIERDKDDLQFQKKKIATTDGQLEAQIRQAKINMIAERIKSKEEKMAEMIQTKDDLEGKMSSQKERDAKRATSQAHYEAKKANFENQKQSRHHNNNNNSQSAPQPKSEIEEAAANGHAIVEATDKVK
jgi:peptidoglycan hydrolase CwlO-like protein